MMDWSGLIIAIVSSLGGAGVLSAFMFYNENKGIKKGDAIGSLANVLDDRIDRFDKILAQKDNIIEDLYKNIDLKNIAIIELKDRVSKLERDSKERDYQLAEQRRINKGLENKIAMLANDKKHSDDRICLLLDCDMREPKLGTYNNESA